MYVRLAFAVAAHLETEILIVDEVLAVGDAVFQKKCLGMMHGVARGGRTVLFVSHNMAAVRKLCDSAILLECGNITESGPVETVISRYYDHPRTSAGGKSDPESSGFQSVSVQNGSGKRVSAIDDIDENCVEFVIKPRPDSKWCLCAFTVFNSEDIGLISSVSPEYMVELDGLARLRARLPVHMLNNGSYRIEGSVSDNNGVIEQAENLVGFQVIRTSSFDQKNPMSRGLVRFESGWAAISPTTLTG